MNIDIIVRDVMNPEFVGVSESDTIGDAGALMLAEGVETVVVLRGPEPVGGLTCRGMLSVVLDGHDPDDTLVGDVMSDAPPTVSIDARLSEAQNRLVGYDGNSLLVVDDDGPTGTLSGRDVLSVTTGGTPEENPSIDRAPDETPSDLGDRTEGGVTQSICESCGGLTSELVSSNGQLVCPDCVEV
ncbi:CBS domain-containing protein [Haloferacaceae archaeon DSL9]